MSYFSEVSSYETYSGQEEDFHFIYNANSGGGQAFLGGRFRDKSGNLVSPFSLNGRVAQLCFHFVDKANVQHNLVLNDEVTSYEIKPRGEGARSMKLGVEGKPTPSDVISAFLMLPETCGVNRTGDINTSILNSKNFWLQSMWLDVEVSTNNTALFIPKDCIFCGGVNKLGEGAPRFFAVNYRKRFLDIIEAASNSSLDDDISKCVRYFSAIYQGKEPFHYHNASNVIKMVMKYLSSKYPEVYSGTLDPMVMIKKLANIKEVSAIPSNISSDILAAIRTKPFILLAGISGTGKSRMVRQLARGCCPRFKSGSTTEDHPLYNKQKPGNFEMIQVRPNWHDSTQLMGYESRVSGKAEFVVKPFVKFLAKAWLYEEEGIPFFLCLDEMNLAPVEQYFAEYLSVIETRQTRDGKIVTDPLVTFPNVDLLREAFKEIYQGVDHDKAERFIKKFIAEGGIPIPQNFIVMGTVNMDETTFSFSRKVLDRAMSFELNEVDMDGGLEGDPDCEYGSIGLESAKCEFTQGHEVYAAAKDDCDKIKSFLVGINRLLDKTPFKIAYRTRNEIMIYCHERTKYGVSLAKALDEATSMKILSRIEGDKRRLVVHDEELAEYNRKGLLESLLDVILKGLKAVRGGEGEYTESGVCSGKLKEMIVQLESGYTSFWTR